MKKTVICQTLWEQQNQQVSLTAEAELHYCALNYDLRPVACQHTKHLTRIRFLAFIIFSEVLSVPGKGKDYLFFLDATV